MLVDKARIGTGGENIFNDPALAVFCCNQQLMVEFGFDVWGTARFRRQEHAHRVGGS